MLGSNPIAIVGGGPAGSITAARLAQSGHRVLLFDEKLAWEKPCGGGITYKALQQWRFLRDAQADRNWIHECELISPSGRHVSFQLQPPIAIFSRLVLNGLLLQRAANAGAEIVQDRIVSLERQNGAWQLRSKNHSWKSEFVVVAAGARNFFRQQLSQAFSPEDLMVTAGYYIPAQSHCMLIRFLHDLHGYIWIFPRADHSSAGICGRMQDRTTSELRRILEQYLDESGLQYRNAQFYSHILPALRSETLQTIPASGTGWAMIGDAAGFVDAMTGEGLYYAMRSGELLAQALIADQPELYPTLLRRDFLPELELAAEMSDRFYCGRWIGESVLERTVQFIAGSESFRRLMSDLFAGTQTYHDLRRRLYLTLPAMLAESLATALRLPKSGHRYEAESEPGLTHAAR